MKTKSSFQDHLRLSTDTVSKWPEWKRTVMGGGLSSRQVCSTGVKNRDGYQPPSGCKRAKP